jgi:hypothetical protein
MPLATTAHPVQAPATRVLGLRSAVLIAAALILLRSAVWVFSESAHFDSDQAITGLMAKHLAEGRAFPLFFYGQHYMLAVEAWIAAPLFWLFGASVATLKLPLLALNLAIAWVLLWVLIRLAGMAPVHALVAVSFFILPTPLVSSRLVEAQGGNIEPFLYVLVLWLLRERPVAFGLLAGFAIAHREFSAYAITAVLAIDAVSGRAYSGQRMRDYLVAFGAMNVVRVAVELLKSRADLLGPGTAGAVSGSLDLQFSTVKSFACWRPAEIASNLRWLAVENLGALFGWAGQTFAFARDHTLTTGGSWLGLALGVSITLSAIAIARQWRQVKESPATGFCCYLILIAIQAALVYAVIGCNVRDQTLIRYTLLTLYFPIGVTALFFSVASDQRWRRAVVTLVTLCAVLSLADNIRYATGWVRWPPRSAHRELANLLESQGVRYARAPYWTAYEIDFLTNERITIASLDKVRIAEYQRIVDEHEARAVYIFEDAACSKDGVAFRQWCLTYLERAQRTP